jgi:hypothetical protein
VPAKPSVRDREVLEEAYNDLISERDRLRAARGGFTGRLGPLPASAAIVIGLAGSSAGKVNPWWIAEAAVLLATLMFISTVYSGLRPYRLMRGRRQRRFDRWTDPASESLAFGLDAPDRASWLAAKIELEQSIYGPPRREQFANLSLRVDHLQDALDVERSAFSLVSILFAEIVLVLVLGLAMRGTDFAIQAGIGGGIAVATALGLLYARHRWHLLEGWRDHAHEPPGESFPAAASPHADG